MIIQLRQQFGWNASTSFGTDCPWFFELPTPEEKWSSYPIWEAKYGWIDFWAALVSKPCRGRIPNVVRLYEEYKDKGFRYYLGVSTWSYEKEAWVGATRTRWLTWTQFRFWLILILQPAYFVANWGYFQLPTYWPGRQKIYRVKIWEVPSLENKLAETSTNKHQLKPIKSLSESIRRLFLPNSVKK